MVLYYLILAMHGWLLSWLQSSDHDHDDYDDSSSIVWWGKKLNRKLRESLHSSQEKAYLASCHIAISIGTIYKCTTILYHIVYDMN